MNYLPYFSHSHFIKALLSLQLQGISVIRLSSLILSLPFMFVMFSGCSQSTRPRPTQDINTAERIICVVSTDCPQGNQCASGLCTPLTNDSECYIDDQCDSTEYCNDGFCSARSYQPTDNCSANDDCTMGQYCQVASQKCVQCLLNAHCLAAEICGVSGRCGASNSCSEDNECGALVCSTSSQTCVACNTSEQCPNGQTCRDHACFGDANNPIGGNGDNGGAAGSCNAPSDCAPFGQICDALQGSCRSCQADNECATDKICRSGICTQDPASTGGSSGEGNSGGGGFGGSGFCLDNSECPGTACFLGSCTACFGDWMCQIGSGNDICQTATGNCIAPQCTSANDCPTAEGCYSGHCGACQYDTECRNGEYCNAVTGECLANAASTQPSNPPANPSNPPGNPPTNPTSPPVTPGNGALGAACTLTTECNTGMICLTKNGSGVCTKTCIGSGATGDCPNGYGCHNYTDGRLDGTQLCLPADFLGTTAAGYPFTQAPGTSCASGNACQSGLCYSDTQTCATGCLANRDCSAGQSCYAYWNTLGPVDLQLCFVSDYINYQAPGTSCNTGRQCNSGLCVGYCGDGSPCNENFDCSTGTCSGTCENHCRNNSDCLTGETCALWPTMIGTSNTQWVPTCMPKAFNGSQADGTSCTSHSQCSSDWCVRSTCTQMCGVNSDCQGGLSAASCLPTTFVDANGQPAYTAAFCRF